MNRSEDRLDGIQQPISRLKMNTLFVSNNTKETFQYIQRKTDCVPSFTCINNLIYVYHLQQTFTFINIKHHKQTSINQPKL